MDDHVKQQIIDTLLGLYDLEVYGFVYGGRGEYPYASRDTLTRFNAQLRRAEQLDPGMADFVFTLPPQGEEVITSHAELLSVLRIVLSRLDPTLTSTLRDYHAEKVASIEKEGRFAENRRDTSRSWSPKDALKDVFLSHAGPDKEGIMAHLVAALDAAGITHWYDDREIQWGDSLTAKVDEGLRKCRYVVVVLSPVFLGRPWPERELNAALGLEIGSGRTHVLPLLAGSDHEIKRALERYPLLADKKYLRWLGDAGPIVEALQRRLRPA